MPYQNIGTPRFYINTVEWLGSLGIISIDDTYRTLPVGTNSLTVTYWAVEEEYTTHNALSTENGYLAFLGHNMTADNNISLQGASSTSIVNGEQNSYYNGFSIWDITGVLTGFVPYNNVAEEITYITVGSILSGTYYDMPHSPELKLTMTREMDGAKRVRTRGGVDLVDHKYTKPPLWANGLAPWEIGGTENQALSRVGRRTWSLSFNFMGGSDLFGPNPMLSMDSGTGYYDTGTGQPDVDIYESGDYTGDSAWSAHSYNLLTDDNFFSQVIHKTNGGQLPMIMQIDNTNNSPDGFAIVKLDMKSFSFQQQSSGLYSCNLKIREVW